MCFLEATNEEGIRDGVWCPLQLIPAFGELPSAPSSISELIKWTVHPGDDPYSRHCIFGLSRRRVAVLMGHSEDAVAAIDVRAQVVLLSPRALSALLSARKLFRDAWGIMERQFATREMFCAISEEHVGNLGILVREFELCIGPMAFVD